jgi:2-enoate reductase
LAILSITVEYLDLAKKIAPKLVEAGIDILHVSGAIGETREHLIQPLYYKQNYHVYLAEGIKYAVGDNTPVITAGSITDPIMAEKILEEGKADLIGMGRGLIADPMFFKKVKAGKIEEIRRCIRCNECINRFRSGYRINCAVNPAAGKEEEFSELIPAKKSKKILVVGGGPAGMEAARVLSLKGHDVTLCEKDELLGGLLRVSTIPHFKKDVLNLVNWLKNQLEQSNVTIHLNTEVTPDYISQFNPDTLIVATGSTPFKPDISGIESVITAVDALKGADVGERVVICGGGLVGCEVAWYLAEMGKKVTIVEMIDSIAYDMEIGSRMAMLKKLSEHNVAVICNLKVEKITPDGIIGIDKTWTKREVKADTVVSAVGFHPNRTLFDTKNKSYEVYIIGDAKKPRRIIDAMREANHVARFEV